MSIIGLRVDFDDFSRRNNVVMWCTATVDARLNVNVALNGQSYQSGTFGDSYGIYHPAYANDGNNSTSVVDGPCVVTSYVTNPWWAVDLGALLYVHSVKFTHAALYGIVCIVFTVD